MGAGARSARERRPVTGLLLGIAVMALAALAATAALLTGGDGAALARLRAVVPPPPVAQDEPGPVLLVPGYGGDTVGLTVLARALEARGRTVEVVRSVGDGRGDLRAAVGPLRAAADRALAAGAPSVDVVGYSAGGVVARLWAQDGGARQARRVVTLGSPHHGTRLAALGSRYLPGACPVGCQQLSPGSGLLEELNAGDETPDGPAWLSVRSADDPVVVPVDTAVLDGAVNVLVQDLCPTASIDHGQLPRDPRVQALVLAALSAAPLGEPDPAVCRAGGPRAAGA